MVSIDFIFIFQHVTTILIYRDCGHHGVCRGPSKILFAWAKNAPPTTLPPSVGFRLGGKDKAGYLVLQIHYAHVLPEGEMDQSGMDLVITTEEYYSLDYVCFTLLNLIFFLKAKIYCWHIYFVVFLCSHSTISTQ